MKRIILTAKKGGSLRSFLSKIGSVGKNIYGKLSGAHDYLTK